MAYTIGLDYGTNTVRAVIVDISNGNEVGTAIWEYETGENGIIIDPNDHNLARQNPVDYIKGLELTVKEAKSNAKAADTNFSSDKIIGIGVDTTGSTPIPVNSHVIPLAMSLDSRINSHPAAKPGYGKTIQDMLRLRKSLS